VSLTPVVVQKHACRIAVSDWFSFCKGALCVLWAGEWVRGVKWEYEGRIKWGHVHNGSEGCVFDVEVVVEG